MFPFHWLSFSCILTTACRLSLLTSNNLKLRYTLLEVDGEYDGEQTCFILNHLFQLLICCFVSNNYLQCSRTGPVYLGSALSSCLSYSPNTESSVTFMLWRKSKGVKVEKVNVLMVNHNPDNLSLLLTVVATRIIV